MRQLCAIAVLVAAALFIGASIQAAEPAKGEKYALLVGVQKYSEAKELRPLPYSESDVTELASVLRNSGCRDENVVLMTQTAANDDPRYLPMKKRILKELRLLLADRTEDDTVLLAFAGHGVHFKDDANSYFCPSDAELDDRSTLLSLTDVYAELEKCKAGVKVLLVDACRNDPFQEATRAARVDLASVTRPEEPEPPKGVIAFFSCSEKEKAYEDEKLGHGVFFHFVIEALRGAAASEGGEVKLLDLSAYVTRRVEDHVRAAYGQTQRPELVGRTSGSPTLVRLASAAAGLAWKFVKGRSFYQEATTATAQILTLDGNDKPIKQNQKQIFYLKWTPLEQDGDDWVVRQKIIGVRLNLDMAGKKVDFDSTQEDAPVTAMTNFFQTLVGSEFKLTLHAPANGPLTITKIEGREDFVKKLAATGEQVKPLLDQVLSEDSLKEMALPLFASAPNKEVARGEGWKTSNMLDMGYVGKYGTDLTFTYEGKEQVGGRELEKVRGEAEMTYQPPKDAEGMPFRIKGASNFSGRGSGQAFFDAKAGRLDHSSLTLDISADLEIEIGDKVTKVNINQTQTSTVRVTDRNPLNE